MADPTADATKAAGFFTSLEKAIEIRAFMLMATFMLAADCSLLQLHGYGILALANGEAPLEARLGVLAVIVFVVFSFLMSSAQPIAKHIEAEVLPRIVGMLKSIAEDYRPEKYNETNRRYGLKSDFVSWGELRRKAHVSMEKYYIDLLKEKTEENRVETEKSANLFLAASALLVASFVNLFLFSGSTSTGVLRGIADRLGSYGTLLVWAYLLYICWTYVIYPVVEERPHRWIYCPNLAQELRKEKEREEDEQRRLSEQYRHTPKPRPLGS